MERKPFIPKIRNKEYLKGYDKVHRTFGDIAQIKFDLPCLSCGREYERVIGELCDNWCQQPMLDLVKMNRSLYG